MTRNMRHIWNMDRPTFATMTSPGYVMECIYMASCAQGNSTKEAISFAVRWARDAGVEKHLAVEWANTMVNNFGIVELFYE